MNTFLRLIFFLILLENIVICSLIPKNRYEKDNNNIENENFGDFDINSFVTRYGYPLEEHNVTTEDGYILLLHRIPYGKTNTEKDNRPPILLVHCLFGTSGVFVMLGPKISLAFQLAEAGYDVWLGNNRGNTYSHQHITLDSKSNATYWDFSFHELGYYDLPATIDFVLTATGRQQLSYVGYSQGTTQFFVMASTRQEYNDKINIMVALAPIAYMEHLSHPLLRILDKYYVEIQGILLKDNVTELFAHSKVVSAAIGLVCRIKKYTEICATLLFTLGGFDSEEFDRSKISDIIHVFPGGGSLKEAVHYLQILRKEYFRQYDYGIIKNRKIYNSNTPPNYNISSITANVALFYSENDLFGSVIDTERLAEELPNVEQHLLSYKLFTHFDYVIAKDLPTLLHFDVINTLNVINGLNTTTSTESTTTLTTSTSKRTPTINTSTYFPSTTGSTTTHPGSANTIKYSVLIVITNLMLLILVI